MFSLNLTSFFFMYPNSAHVCGQVCIFLPGPPAHIIKHTNSEFIHFSCGLSIASPLRSRFACSSSANLFDWYIFSRNNLIYQGIKNETLLAQSSKNLIISLLAQIYISKNKHCGVRMYVHVGVSTICTCECSHILVSKQYSCIIDVCYVCNLQIARH